MVLMVDANKAKLGTSCGTCAFAAAEMSLSAVIEGEAAIPVVRHLVPGVYGSL